MAFPERESSASVSPVKSLKTRGYRIDCQIGRTIVTCRNKGTRKVGDRLGMMAFQARQLMTLLVFLGIVVSLLILRLIPGLLLRLVLAVPRHHFVALMRRIHNRKISIAMLPRTPATPRSRLKLVLVSSSLLALALLATTAFWSWHSASLMMLLR
jgi:hypothetical protein